MYSVNPTTVPTAAATVAANPKTISLSAVIAEQTIIESKYREYTLLTIGHKEAVLSAGTETLN